MDIDYEALSHAILENLDDSIQDNYDIDVLLKTAEPCWDGTGIRVKSKDFEMVFNSVDYSVEDYTGFDLV